MCLSVAAMFACGDDGGSLTLCDGGLVAGGGECVPDRLADGWESCRSTYEVIGSSICGETFECGVHTLELDCSGTLSCRCIENGVDVTTFNAEGSCDGTSSEFRATLAEANCGWPLDGV
jgi:hypothetical protein